MSTQGPDESRLARWSRRKRDLSDTGQVGDAVDQSSDVQVDANRTDRLETTQNSGSDPLSKPISEIENKAAENDAAEIDGSLEEELLTDEDMPSLDTIDSKSDVSCFLNKGVSKALRNKALRHLFMQPAFNIRDGLNDYDEDYTYFKPLGDIVTSDMKFQAERKERLERERELAEANEQELDTDSKETESTEPDVAENDAAENDAAENDATEKNVSEADTGSDEALPTEEPQFSHEGSPIEAQAGAEKGDDSPESSRPTPQLEVNSSMKTTKKGRATRA